MRPGFVFVSLFVVLIAIYALLSDTLGSTLTFILQAALVLLLLAAATWYRRSRKTARVVDLGDVTPGAESGAEVPAGEPAEEPSMRRAS